MKRIVLILTVCIPVLVGCTKTDNDENQGKTFWGWGLRTAEKLTDQLNIRVFPLHIGPETVYYTGFKPPKDDFVLDIFVTFDAKAWEPSYVWGSEEHKAFQEWGLSLYENGVASECKDSTCAHLTTHDFVYAGIAEGAKIYADRVLWGRKPGEDLADMFILPRFSNGNRLIVTYPEFHILYGWDDKHPETFRELTSNRIALSNPCVATVTFAEIPPEEFDTVTFTVEIPVDVEYYEDYSPEMYELHPTLKPEGRRLLKGSCTVNFIK